MPERPSKLVTIQEQPYNAETPLGALAGACTPTDLFYVRTHFDMPAVEGSQWKLTLDGGVRTSLQVGLDDLKKLPATTRLVTLECAGNGRTAMTPLPPGTRWNFGAAATAEFTGTPLVGLLDRAGIAPSGCEVLCVGADQGEVAAGRQVIYERSLPLHVARDPDTLVAWAMNGADLTREHGFPARLIVPRWYAMASVKWLVRLAVLAQPFAGFFQREQYVYEQENGIADGTPVREMRVRSVIAYPAANATLGREPVEIAGSAWSGFGAINRVEVSCDDGTLWTPADLQAPDSPFGPTLWKVSWIPPRTGAFTLVARATDAYGNTQPTQSVSNRQGYGNNVTQRVRVRVE